MKGTNYERELKQLLRKEGWIVIRSAGSFAYDIVALKPDKHIIIEVKSTKKDKFNISYSKRDREQFDVLNELAKQGFNTMYYIRWKGRKPKWSKYQLPLEPYPSFIHKKEKEVK